MKNCFIHIFFLFLMPFLASSQKISIPLNLSDEHKSLVLSEVMEVKQIIPLQTTSDNFLPDQITVIPMKEYIIIIDMERNIQQYSIDGKFIRILAKRGPGPEEFNFIWAYETDDVSSRFYFTHQGDPTHIQVVDLVKGKRLKQISIPYKNITDTDNKPIMKDIVLIGSNTIGCIPIDLTGMKFPIFYMDLSGKFLSGIPHLGDSKSEPSNYSVVRTIDNIRLTMNHKENYDNTTYSLRNGIATPFFTLDIIKSEEVKDLYDVIFLVEAEGPEKMVVKLAHINWVENGGLQVFKWQIFVEKSTKRAYRISNINIDYLGGLSIEQWPLFYSNGSLGAVKVGAFEFREFAKEKLKSGSLSPEVRARLEKLYKKLKDDDNPVILIGEMK